MTSHNDITEWGRSENYKNEFLLGCEGENGEHIRGIKNGWPYSIYRESIAIGGCDAVLCHGIQNFGDAVRLLDLVNADFAIRFPEIRPKIDQKTIEMMEEQFDRDLGAKQKLIDRIADLMGIPDNVELDQTTFELWWTRNNIDDAIKTPLGNVGNLLGP